MRVGTRSLLYGAHQAVLHPLFLFVAWWMLYGFPTDLRLWVAFVIHDWGYFGCGDMDGEDGQHHPELGGAIMDFLFGPPWGEFTRLHSRHYALAHGVAPSPLCAADKMVLLIEPDWLYLPRVILSGEVAEYLEMYARWTGVSRVSIGTWYRGLRNDWRKEVCLLAPSSAFARSRATPPAGPGR